MKITDVRVDGFGVWTGLAMDDLSAGLSVWFGRNEAGKTTLMQFIRTVLYGVTPERRRRYLPPVHGGEAGGSLVVETAQGPMKIARLLDGETVGQVTVTDFEGSPQPAAAIASLLGVVDEQVFTNVFAVGIRELQELGTLNDSDAAELLYRLSSGLERVSLVEVLERVDVARQELISPATPSGIPALGSQRERLRRQMADLARSGEQWLRLTATQSALDQEIAQQEQTMSQLRRRTSLIEAAIGLNDTWSARCELDRQLASLGPVNQLDSDLVGRLQTTTTRLERRRRQLSATKKRMRQIRKQARQIPVNAALRSQAARIEAVGEHAPWMLTLESQISRLGADVSQLEQQLAEAQGAATWTGSSAPEIPAVSDHVLSVLKAPARQATTDRQRLRQARRDWDEARQAECQARVELESKVAELGHADLAGALDQSGNLVKSLRRRVHLEERLDKMTRSRKELDEERQELLEEQILPMPVLLGLGIPFVIGVMLILAGIVWQSAAMIGWPIALLGLGGWGVSVFVKMSLEKTAARELAECTQQLEHLHDQIKQVRANRDEMDAQLPTGGGPLDARLASAEQNLGRLEELLPRDAAWQASVQKCEAAERRVREATEAARESRHRWTVALKRLGLPPQLTPKTLRIVSGGSRELDQLRRQLKLRREDLDSRRRELRSIAGRITELMDAAAITPDHDGPLEQLEQLTAALAEQQRAAQRRAALRSQYRQLRRKKVRYQGSARKLAVRQRAALQSLGIEDSDRLQSLIDRISQYHELVQARETLNVQIDSALGGHFVVDDLEREWAAGQPLEPRWDEAASRLEQCQTELGRLHERRGQIRQEMNALADDRRLEETRLELAAMETRLAKAVRNWQTLVVTTVLLEEVRLLYETERQPETLRDASTYLHDLTSGQYRRVWTTLGERRLRVDAEDGQSLPLEVLSRGTREAVFLSLRLALAAQYERRGTSLPLVLDDVLINLDGQRAQAAVKVLRKFSREGHQLILFTCHDHIAKLFKSARIDVRVLPDHKELMAVATANVTAAAAIETVAAAIDDAETCEDETEIEVLDEVDDLDEEELADDEEEGEEDAAEDEEYEEEYDEEYAEDDEVDEEEDEVEDVEAEDEEAEYEDEEEDDEEEDDEEDDEEDGDEEEDDEVDEIADEEEEDEVDAIGPMVAAGDEDERFTWESPERWSQGDGEHEAEGAKKKKRRRRDDAA